MALAVLGCRLLLLKCDLFFSLFNKESARAGPSLAGRGTRLGKTLLCRGLRSLALPAGAVSAASRAPATATRTHARKVSQRGRRERPLGPLRSPESPARSLAGHLDSRAPWSRRSLQGRKRRVPHVSGRVKSLAPLARLGEGERGTGKAFVFGKLCVPSRARS